MFKVMLSCCTNLSLWAGQRSRNNMSTEERSLLITKWRGQTFLFKTNRPLWLWMDYRMDWSAKWRMIRFRLRCYRGPSLALMLAQEYFMLSVHVVQVVARYNMGNMHGEHGRQSITEWMNLASCVIYTNPITRLAQCWMLRNLFGNVSPECLQKATLYSRRWFSKNLCILQKRPGLCKFTHK